MIFHQTVEFSLANNGEIKALREEKRIREAGKMRAERSIALNKQLLEIAKERLTAGG